MCYLDKTEEALYTKLKKPFHAFNKQFSSFDVSQDVILENKDVIKYSEIAKKSSL